ncbi:MAG: SRPBCC family protein [Muribaculaceae bacterium]|nr:SRPBCC family protein [Muribaculaceae bacterium]
MSVYSGKAVVLGRTVDEVYAKVSDLGQYKEMVEQLPAEQREQLAGVEFRGDALKMDAPGVGEMVFKVTERVPGKKVVMNAEGSPIPLKIILDMVAEDEASTRLTPRVDIDIPAMLKPFLGNKIQQAADKFGEVFTSLF